MESVFDSLRIPVDNSLANNSLTSSWPRWLSGYECGRAPPRRGEIMSQHSRKPKVSIKKNHFHQHISLFLPPLFIFNLFIHFSLPHTQLLPHFLHYNFLHNVFLSAIYLSSNEISMENTVFSSSVLKDLMRIHPLKSFTTCYRTYY